VTIDPPTTPDATEATPAVATTLETRPWWSPRRLIRGRPGDPPWVRPALLALLAATALLYLIGLGRSGWANAFYSAAAQAGSASWKALFFGSSDAASFITVDKPPLSLWVMGISARVFGVSAWSILVPQALMGVAAVGVLYATVRRWASPAAGLLAGAVLALTPVATLMFRFNNPDALLVLLMTLAAYATVRALEHASWRWLMLVGVLVGCGFMTKMLQAFLVVPVFALVYLIAAPAGLRRRLWHILLAGVALVVSSGWWVAVVELWPTSSRPYIGGSQTNSVLELIFGYNGFGRLTGNETGSVTPGGSAVGRAAAGGGSQWWGATGIGRMFSASWGGQIAWLLPAALALIAVLFWISWRSPRTDRTRAAAILWGGTLLVTLVVFSFGKGIIHEYYSVALAPPIGALVGMGSLALWERRKQLAARLALAAILASSSAWAFVLLDRSASWNPWLRFVVLAAGLVTAVLLAMGERLDRRVALAAGLAGVIVALAGPAAYSLQTAATAHSGSLPTAGPTVAGAGRFGGGNGPGRAFSRNGGAGFGGQTTAGQGGAPAGAPAANGGTLPAAPPGGFSTQTAGTNGPPGAGAFGGAGTSDGFAGGPGNAAGGLLNASQPSAALVAALKQDSGRYTWVAATVGAQSAAGYQLATDDPVMSLGGFNGSDPYPTLAEFQALARAGKVHYFIAGGMGGGGGTGSTSMSAITSWVKSTYSTHTVGGTTLYDLSSPKTTAAK
jgi:4-amino-4-deoxy-L-arabinose transferase-like glycosyltransferase